MNEEKIKEELEKIDGVQTAIITHTVYDGVSAILFGDVEKIEIDEPQPCVKCKHNGECEIQSDAMEFYNKHIDDVQKMDVFCGKFDSKERVK